MRDGWGREGEGEKEEETDPNLNNVENAGNGAPIWLGKGICGVVKRLPKFLSFKGEARPRIAYFGLFIWPLKSSIFR